MKTNQPPEKLLNLFSEHGTPNSFRKGKILVAPEEKITQIHIIKSGILRHYSVNDNGDDVTIHLHTAPALIPLMLLFSTKPNQHYIEAVTDIETVSVKTQVIKKAVKASPEISQYFLKSFANAMKGMSDRIELLATQKAGDSLLQILTYISKKFGRPVSDGTKITLKLTHNDIASWLGTTRETISREIKLLDQAGKIIYRNGEIIIPTNNSKV